MRRGEVRWYRFQTPDKKRPVVILTRDSALEYLGEVTIAPVTSTVRGIPSEVVLGDDDGLTRECAVNLDHIQTVARGRVGALIATLSPRRMAEIRSAMLFALGYT
ncbi:MAG: PemK family transcriptional regulator [Acidobacteria bacterium RBG_16_68_9]|nr:MAG: PemK family transcriptional regulator [Acidobacteria bacterium RBG_16_68_9]